MDSASELDATAATTVAEEQTLSMKVIETAAAANQPDDPDHPSLQLSCQIPLQRPRIRSTPDRRKRLSDSLISGDASHNAGTLARDPHFWDFLQQINLMAYEGEIDTRRARHFINRVCGVNGRYDFEHCCDAALRYFTLIEQPFLDWLLAEDDD
jgi:hypothetical protein